MIVAITGASGFVGGHITRTLLGRGHRLRVLSRDAAPRYRDDPAVTVVRGDLRDPAALESLVRGAAAVVHLVGIIIERGGATYTAVHVEGTRSLVGAARAARCDRFVHMSAAGVRDAPGATTYQRTKARGEQVVLESGLRAVALRPSFIVGPENVPVRTLARLHRLSPVVPVFGAGDYLLQPVWVGDVALAFALAVERPQLTGAFELGGPAAVPYVDFVREIGRAAGHPRPLVHVPLRLVRLVARLCEVLPTPPITSDQLRMLVEGNATPANAITATFGIAPLPLPEALRRSFA